VSSSPTDTFVDVLLPALGSSVSEGTVIGWAKAVGEHVDEDETLCEISTDKIDTECPSPATGVLAEILVEAGRTVDVGTVLARVAVGGNGHDGNGHDRSRVLSPVVRRMAERHHLDLSGIAGSGAGGRVTKQDVLAHLAQAEPERPLHSESPYRPEPETETLPAGGVPVPLSRMRQAIGAAMRRSQATAAICHTVIECDMSHVEARRAELGLTALPLVARATVDALREFPTINATLEDTTITRYDRVHLGIAVSLGADGLIVPVIHDAQDLSAEGLAARIKELAARARAGELSPDDVHGATFTITNPGGYGTVLATPVINLPQVAILDLEAIVRRPVVVADGQGGEAIAIRPMANLILGWDHRAIDGAEAAQFLAALRGRLERVA
jgi:pyruvate/2-oxoglutarate dehydrogenase complex dihydrolipoamide acyltransferase (E2) component